MNIDPKHLERLEKDSAIGYTPVIKTKPKYAIIHHAPSMNLISRSIRFSDYSQLLSLSFLGAALGYIGGKIKIMKKFINTKKKKILMMRMIC